MVRKRLFPLYGVSRQRNEFQRKFIMWPFWTQAKYNFKSVQGDAWMLWPIYGQLKLSNQEVRWFVPPLFRMAKGGNNTRSHALWPVVQRSKGEVDKFYLWPLYGQKKVGHVSSQFYIWPIISRKQLDRKEELVHRSYALPIWYAHTHRAKTKNGEIEKEPYSVYRKVWPLFSYRREHSVSRFRSLALWPLKQSGPIDRNWAPFWTLYEHHNVNGKTDTEVLWGLYRRSVRPGEYRSASLFPLMEWRTDHTETGHHLSWNVLKGLVGSHWEDEARRYRLLYFFSWGGKDSLE